MRMNEHLRKLLELNFKQGEKVKISPIGEVTGLDGRTFRIDGEAVISATKENGVDLVLDINHGFDGSGEAAAGWFKIDTLELREDGIYAELELTSIGEENVNKKLYRYLSPAYIMDRNKEDRTVLALDSLGLVNRPNLLKDALNNKQKDDDTAKQLKELNTKIETLTLEKNQIKDTAEASAKELGEANTKLETATSNLVEANSTIKGLRIDLAVSKNQILPRDVEFCRTLDDDQLESYIKNNSGKDLAGELSGDLKPKENNSKDDVLEAAIKAGSRK